MNQVVDFFQNAFDPLRELPLLSLLLIGVLLWAVARFRRIYPQALFVLLLVVPCLLTAGLIHQQDVLPLIVALDAAVAGMAIWDVFSFPRREVFAAERECQRIASLQKNHPVTLTISNRGRREYQIWIRDDVPQQFQPSPKQFFVRLRPGSRAVLKYELTSSRRGAFRMERIYLRIRSRLGLWQAFRDYPVASDIHVFPDMQQLSKYAVLARTNRLSLIGVRRTRRVGQDHEFERLRDYTPDDNYKHIDWRSTARRNKLTVKDFQASQSQRLIFLLDCGRMMTNETGGISLLDHALNAMLMLSYVALRQGDSVGMVGFSDQIHAFVPPSGGMNQMNRLLHASFDRFPRLVESRYDQAFLYLSSHCQKRSLVVLATNVIDEVNANQIHRYLSSLAGRHLPLGVLLRDHQLFDAADTVDPSEERLYRCAAAAEILAWRHQVLRDLEHRGVLALDVFPEEMTAPLVNKYLEIKARPTFSDSLDWQRNT